MSEVNVGDRVAIRVVINPLYRAFVGDSGIVERITRTGCYAVRMERGALIIAAAVEKIDDVVRPLTASERALYAAENHDWRDEASELDRRRLQAAEFAHRTLGTDALLEDVIGLADWILDNPEASAKDIKRVTFNPGGVIFAPNDAETTRRLAEELAKSGRIVAEPQEPPRPPANLEIRDKDGDCLHLAYTHTLAGIVAVIDARSHGDVCATYVNAEDADRIIAFLQAAKAAKA